MLIWLKNQGKVRYRTFQLRFLREHAEEELLRRAAQKSAGDVRRQRADQVRLFGPVLVDSSDEDETASEVFERTLQTFFSRKDDGRGIGEHDGLWKPRTYHQLAHAKKLRKQREVQAEAAKELAETVAHDIEVVTTLVERFDIEPFSDFSAK